MSKLHPAIRSVTSSDHQTTQITSLDFAHLTGPQLVEAYNSMILTAVDLGLSQAAAQTVKRFSGLDAGRTRCEKLHKLITELRADVELAQGGPAEGRPAGAPAPGAAAAAQHETEPREPEGDLRPTNLQTGSSDVACTYPNCKCI